jgi:hypothetical protein
VLITPRSRRSQEIGIGDRIRQEGDPKHSGGTEAASEEGERTAALVLASALKKPECDESTAGKHSEVTSSERETYFEGRTTPTEMWI